MSNANKCDILVVGTSSGNVNSPKTVVRHESRIDGMNAIYIYMKIGQKAKGLL